MNRRDFLKLGAIAGAAGAAGVGAYTWLVEPHWLEIVERDLPIAHLPPTLLGGRLVQISDMHVGPRVDDDYLIESLDRAAALRPDITVVTGRPHVVRLRAGCRATRAAPARAHPSPARPARHPRHPR
ncbi:MAG: twin-arginine translocation signal domain-containing protein [Gemmatimonadaceae bacterium]